MADRVISLPSPGSLHDRARHAVLDTTAHKAIQDLKLLALAALGRCRLELVIAERDRAWFKNSLGIESHLDSAQLAFFDAASRHGLALSVPDARMDERFRHHEAVASVGGIVSFATLPLQTPEGHILGSVWLLASEVRASDADVQILRLCASQVLTYFQLLRSQAQQKSEQEALQFHRKFFRLAPELLCTFDASLHFREISPGWELALGTDTSVLRTMTLLDLVHDDDRARTRQETERLLEAGGQGVDFEVRCRHADGHWLTLSWAWTSQSGTIFGAARDVTAHKALQEALAQSETNLRTLVATMPIGICVSHGRTMCYVNRALIEMLGYDAPSDLEGREALSVLHDDSKPTLLARYQAMASGAPPPPTVLQCLKRDGSTVQVEVSSMFTHFDGQQSNLAIIRDVTESQRARRALAQSEAERDAAYEKLVASNAQKETLLKEIHHRVKNNLQVIVSLLRLGRSTVADAAALSVFDDSVARVHSIALVHERLYQSRDLSKIDMSIYLSGLVAELLRANATQKHVAASVRADPIEFDMDRCVPIGLIVNELVGNALKHAFPSTSSPAEVVIGLREHAETFELSVQDNGVGFDSTKARAGSLGLRIVSTLTKQLGGANHVLSTGGTTWRVTFPKRVECDEPV